jgi:hypothetical protein
MVDGISGKMSIGVFKTHDRSHIPLHLFPALISGLPPEYRQDLLPALLESYLPSPPHLSAHNECLSTKILAYSLLSLLTVTTNTGNRINNELFTRYRLIPFPNQQISKCPRCVHCVIDQEAPGLLFA